MDFGKFMKEDPEDRRNKRTIGAMLVAACITAVLGLVGSIAAARIIAGSDDHHVAIPAPGPSPNTSTTTSIKPPTASNPQVGARHPWCKSNSYPIVNLKAATFYCEGVPGTQVNFKVNLEVVGSMQIERDGNASSNLDLCKFYRAITGYGGPAVEYYIVDKKLSEIAVSISTIAKNTC